jgi:tetratricopeptide (TPR) repeat protein
MKTFFLMIIVITGIVSIVTAGEIRFDADSLDKNALTSQMMKVVQDAVDWNKKGLDLLDNNDYDGAMKCFNEAITILPDYSDAINNRGVIKFRRGDIPGAQEIWQKLAVNDPTYALASYNLALIQVNQKQFDAAIRMLERALKSDKQFVEAKVRLGAIHLERNEKGKALEELHAAYKMAPTHADAWSFYAYALVRNGDTTEAVAILKKNSDKSVALKMLGEIEESRKNYSVAGTYYSQAIGLGADPALLIECASVQMDAKNCTAALQTLKTYFGMNIPHSADAWLLAGIASKECGDVAGSQNYFEQGSKNFPQDGVIRYNLGQVYFYQKKYDQAENTWTGLSDTLQDPSLLYLRAINAKRKNDFPEAESIIKRALELDDRAEFHDFLGAILFHQGKTKDAAGEFRKAAEINPNLRSAQLNLALCSKSGGDLSSAAAMLEKKLGQCGADSCAEIALQLSVVYYYQKLFDKAAATLSSVKENDRDERIYRHLAIYYKELQEWGKAINALETAVNKFVTEPQTDYELAEAYLMAGYYAKAIDRYNLLLPKWQQNPWRIYYQLGYAYFEQNDFVNAKKCFEKSVNCKNNVAARGLLAFIYNKEGNVSQARELWKKNLTDDPSNAAMWVNMGLSYERDGKYEDAITDYKKALDLKSNDPQIQINLGNALTSAGRYTEALNAYKQALNSPKKEVAEYNIFLVYAKKRDKELAGKSLRVLEKDFIASANTKRAQSEIALWDGDTVNALKQLESLSDKEAGDWMALAKVYGEIGNRQKSIECLSKVPEEAQWENDRATIKAMLAFQEGNYEEVVQHFSQNRDTGFVAQYNLALAYFNLKKYSDALVIAERLAKTAGSNDRVDLCRLAGNSAFGLKQWEKARQWYLQLSNVEAHSSIVQYNLAVASYNLGKVEDAWKYYQRARELDSKITNADIEKRYASTQSDSKVNQNSIAPLDSMFNAGVDLQNSGNDSAAEKLYLQVVAKDSLYNLAWNNLGAIYGKWGEIDKAEHAYQKAVEKKHDIPEAYANLVTFYIALEEFTKARQWLIKGAGHNPESELLKNLKQKIIDAEKKAGKNQNH